jgi:hypothetical protein
MVNTSLLPDIVLTRRRTDGPRGPEYASSRKLSAWVETSFKRIASQLGAETVASAYLICPSYADLRSGDEVCADGRRYEVIETATYRQGSRVHHIEAWLKSLGGNA